MSLHDIDKGGVRRKLPSPNADDSITQRYAHGTVQNQNSQEEAQADGLKFLERQIIARQDGFNKAAFGFYGEANKFGLKVAEDGKDVLTAGDDELVFNSEQNVFKIVLDGDAAVTLTADDGGFTTVAHGLGFSPIPMVFIDNGSGGYEQLPYTVYTSVTVGAVTGWLPTQIFRARVDDTQLTIIVDYPLGSSNTVTWNFKYYLLQETAN